MEGLDADGVLGVQNQGDGGVRGEVPQHGGLPDLAFHPIIRFEDAVLLLRVGQQAQAQALVQVRGGQGAQGGICQGAVHEVVHQLRQLSQIIQARGVHGQGPQGDMCGTTIGSVHHRGGTVDGDLGVLERETVLQFAAEHVRPGAVELGQVSVGEEIRRGEDAIAIPLDLLLHRVTRSTTGHGGEVRVGVIGGVFRRSRMFHRFLPAVLSETSSEKPEGHESRLLLWRSLTRSCSKS